MKKCFWCGELDDPDFHECNKKKRDMRMSFYIVVLLVGLVGIGGLIAGEPVVIGLSLLLLFFLYKNEP